MQGADEVGAARAAESARDARDLKAEEPPARGIMMDGAVLRGLAGLSPEFGAVVVDLVRDNGVADALEYPERLLLAVTLRRQRVNLVEPGARIRRSGAVLGGEELIQKRLKRLVDLPKVLGHQVGL